MKKTIVLFLLVLTSTFVSAQSEVIVAGDNVCLRLRPDEGSKLTGSQFPHFYTGNTLPCTGQVNGYYRVVYDGHTYYLPKRYARPRGTSGYSSSTPVAFDYIVIAGDGVCLRAQPNENTKLTGSSYKHFNTGEYVECAGVVGNYYKIIYDGRYYYIPQKYGRPRN